MTTAFDVPPDLLIERLGAALKTGGKATPPEWAPFVRTGLHTEKAPQDRDWWFRRLAAVFRRVYTMGPIGTSRLAAEFGGRHRDGSAPPHPRKGSGAITRESLQQLESLGVVAKAEARGRRVTPAGQKMLDH